MTARILIDGAFTGSASSRTIDVINPNTGDLLDRIADCNADDVAAALEAAVAAQKAWWAKTARDRSVALHAVATRLEQSDWTALLDLLCDEVGKARPDAETEVGQAIPALRYFAELSRHDQGTVAGNTFVGNLHYCQYEPYGVTLHMVPYNFPMLLLCWTVAASVAAGNAAVIKPSEKASLFTLKLMEYFGDLPAGLVTCLTGGADTARALIDHPAIAKIAFTGSSKTAKAVYTAAAQHLKPCLIEAGGSDPLVVAASIDPDIAAAGTVNSAFFYAGQVCTSVERIFVEEPIYEPFLAALKTRTEALRVGPTRGHVDVGPLIDRAALERVEGMVARALQQGARLVTGGRRSQIEAGGWFYDPTVLADCSPDMEIMNEEIFGPVAAVAKVASVQEGIDRANASRYGLGASIFTSNLSEAMAAVQRFEAGMVWVNNPLIDNDALPFGGRKQSGFGRELSRTGLDEFRQPKMVIMDPNPVHQDWWMPYRYPGA